MKSRKEKQRLAARRRFLGLEQLERREVLAGNVAAVIQSGDLFLDGDNLGNNISITRSGPSSITITGNGTTVNGQSSVTLANFQRNITIDLKGGDDSVTFTRTTDDLFRIYGGLTVNTGSGDDQVIFKDTEVQGLLFIDTGSGNDRVSASPGTSGWGLRGLGVSSILMGSGNDVVSLDHAHFARTVSILLEDGDDNLFVSNSSAYRTVVLNGGNGNDRLDRLSTYTAQQPMVVHFQSIGSNPAPATNSPPVAVSDAATVAEGAAASINVAGNDSDPDGSLNLASVVITQNPANGSVTVNNDGTVTYVHNGSETTSDSFRYTIKDNLGAVSGTATVTITVTPVNDPPVAANDAATVAEGASTAIPVAANDTDVDGTIDPTSIVITQNATNGSVVVNANGTVTYTHNGSETTSDTFRYTIKDNSGAVSNIATVSITVTPVNDAPVAVDDLATVAEGGTLAIPVSTNDTDVDGTIDVTSIVIVQAPTNGTAVANANGTVTYTHDGSNTTSDSFTYTIKDNDGAVSNVATVAITVTAVNDPPVAVDDVLTLNEGATGVVNVTSNDTDSDGTVDVATVVIVQAPAHGTAVANANGTVTYTHDGSETTSDSFTYTVRDNLGAISGIATVNITITPVNDAPVAANDVANVAEGGTVTLNVAANDSDVDGSIDLTSIVIVQAPAHGSVVVNNDGTVIYTHDGSNTTSDSFTYTIQDNSGATSNVATVSITVTAVNDPPVAVDDAATVDEGGAVIINVAANDTDVDSTLDLTSIVITQNPAHGTVTVNNNGTVTYTDDGSETTSDSFTYTIQDIQGAVSNVATVNITITPVNDAPVAANDSSTVNEGGSVIIDVAANDTDVDGTLDLTSIVIVQSPAHGTVVVNNDGTVTYTHDGSNSTSDSFTYTLQDNSGEVSNVATVSITVTAVNDPPVAANDIATVDEGGSVIIDLAANDTDSDGTLDLTSIVIVQSPAHGTVVVNNDGTITYTHDGSETVSDSFTYTIQDNNGAVSNIATVAITVTPVNDAPVATNDVANVAEGGAVTLNVAANDTDVDGTLDLTSIVIVQNPVNGTVIVNNNGTVTYTHDGSNTTSDSFTYTIQDNSGATSNAATVTITVAAVNDPPVAADDAATVDEGASVSINVAANDTDADTTLDLTSIVIVQSPAHGTVIVNNNGTVTYTHDGSETTSDSFTYTIQDIQGAVSNVATVNITVTPVNDAPVAVDDSSNVDEGNSVIIDVAANDTDVDGTLDLTSIVIVQNPAHGTAVANNDGTVTYTHDGSETTSDSFTYDIKDNLGAVSGIATVNITITPVNDAPVAVDDADTVDEGDVVTIDVAANDSDADGTLDLTSIVIVQNPAHGTAVANNDGTVTYTHDGSETTSDSFTYTIQDNNGAVSGTATVNITITPVNDAPVAADDSETVDEGNSVIIDVAANDSDVDGTIDLTSIVIIQVPAHGTAVANNDGTVTYTHDGSETTSDSFTYTIKDNLGAVSGIATVNITITPVNDAPVAVDDVATVNEGALVIIDVAANDTDVDGTIDLTSIVITQNPAHGNIVVNGNGTVSYTHDGSETTSDSFQYTILDNNGQVSGTATVTITVTPVNDPPVANDDSASVATGASVIIDVANNDTDADDALDLTSIVITQAPVNGILTVNGDGTVTYTHDGSATTSDSFQYTIQDASGADSNVASVTLTIS